MKMADTTDLCLKMADHETLVKRIRKVYKAGKSPTRTTTLSEKVLAYG